MTILNNTSKNPKRRMMPIFKIKNKYYTRIRWVTDYNDRSEVKFPLGTDDKLVAEHRRDTIQFTSLRGKIISAYEKNSTEGVKSLKAEIDWFKNGGALVDTTVTLTDAINDYEKYLISQRLGIKTIEIYLRTLNEFTLSIKMNRLNKIKPKHFTDYKNSMPHLSTHTVNRKLRSLQTFFNWLYDEGHIKNQTRIKKIPAVQRPVRFFSDAEFKQILKNVRKGFPHNEAKMEKEDRELFVNAYRLYRDTGMRLSEPFDNELLMDARRYRLQITGSTTKNSYQRYVHLTEQQAMTIIQMNVWLERQLKARKNRYGTIKVFSRVFAKALKKTHLKGKLHDLRKTFASRLWFLTGQEFALCYALGHTDTSMTKQYTSLDKVELARAFPDIADKKNSIVEDKTSLRVPKQGDIELYSNFGFMVKKS
jgi:integrase